MLTQPNKENIAKWVQALRSGEFLQGKGRLCKIETTADGQPLRRYCCLGVACEVAMENGVELPKMVSDGTVSYGGSLGHLPIEVQRWLGIAFEDPQVTLSPNGVDYPVKYGLVHVNDHLELTFAQIADAIEAKYLKDEDVHA